MWHGVTMISGACRDNNQNWCHHYCSFLFSHLQPRYSHRPKKGNKKKIPPSLSLLFSALSQFWPKYPHERWESRNMNRIHTHTQRWMIYCVFLFCAGVKMASYKYALMCFTNFTNYSRMIYTAMSSVNIAKAIFFNEQCGWGHFEQRNISSFLPTNKHANKQITPKPKHRQENKEKRKNEQGKEQASIEKEAKKKTT